MKKLTITLSAVLCAGMLFGATDEIGSAVARTFAGRTAVITGAASGMGLCTARTLAEAGATVFMCDINGEGVEKAAAEINSWYNVRHEAVAQLQDQPVLLPDAACEVGLHRGCWRREESLSAGKQYRILRKGKAVICA